MIVKTSLGDTTVSFRHEEFEGSRATICTVVAGPPDAPDDSFGIAVTHPKDNFCRATGRKIALERAIGHWSKADRRLIWQAYWKSINQERGS
jgi:hypothetical protein